jgi:hypothetical protein
VPPGTVPRHAGVGVFFIHLASWIRRPVCPSLHSLKSTDGRAMNLQPALIAFYHFFRLYPVPSSVMQQDGSGASGPAWGQRRVDDLISAGDDAVAESGLR